MNLFTDSTVPSLARFLDLSAARQRLIASNLANIDTPGYRTRDIDFQTEMRNALGKEPTVKQVQDLAERPDGNNVSVDREGLLLAENQLQFRVGVQLLRTEFRRLLSAINEGK